MIEELRRKEDRGVWKWFRLYPVFVGFMLAMISIGGYFATIKYMGFQIQEIRSSSDLTRMISLDNTRLLSRMVALQESVDKRVSRLENINDRRINN